MTGILRILGLFAAAVLAVPASAVTWTADEQNPANVQTVQACSGSTVACQYTLVDTATGTALKLRAYSNTAWMPSSSGGVATVGTGTYTTTGSNSINSSGWTAANNKYYSGENAFGISNNIQYASTDEGTVPELGVDNKEVLDLMVIELPQIAGQTWDLSSFMLGWANENGLAQSDVSMFIGGSSLGSNFDFSGVCIDTALSALGGCRPGETALSTLGGGFQNITSAIANGGNNIAQLTSTAVNTADTGNYIVMTGALGQGDDSFKLKSITAGTVNVPHAPAPGTLALLGLGLIPLLGMRRRPGSVMA